MIVTSITHCPACGSSLKYYDHVDRILRRKGGGIKHVQIRRLRCTGCRKIHRELPRHVLPYKQYEAEIIRGVLEGFITSDTFGYEDFPCNMTMIRWINTLNLQMLL